MIWPLLMALHYEIKKQNVIFDDDLAENYIVYTNQVYYQVIRHHLFCFGLPKFNKDLIPT